MIPYPIRFNPPLLTWRWSTALAGVMFAALFVQSMPRPFGTWAMLSVVYVSVEMLGRTPVPTAGGSGWPVLVAMAVALEPQGAVLGAGLAVAVATGLDLVRGVTAGAIGDRFLAHVPPVAVAVIVTSLTTSGTPSLPAALAGMLAGAAAYLLGRSVIPGLALDASWTGGRAPDHRSLVESMAIGGTAALLGGMLASGDWTAAPLVVIGLIVIVALERGDRRVAGARQAVIRSLLMALEAKDLYTRGHAVRVGELGALIAFEMGLSPERTERLVTAALLHDMGKVATSRQLLRKSGRLTPAEYQRVREHAEVTDELLGGIGCLGDVAPIVSEHHASVEGGGNGRVNADAYGRIIADVPCLEARIVAVADGFDAMTSHRPYRRALSRHYAFAELRRGAGSQFDADVVETLIRCVEATGEVATIVGAATDEEGRKLAEMAVAHA